MTYIKIDIHQRNFETAIKWLDKDNNISNNEKEQVKEFLRQARIGKINLRQKIGESRLIKYIEILKIPLAYFKKDVENLTLEDIERFVHELEENIIKKRDKVDGYSDSTKADIKNLFKIYLKFRIKDFEKYTRFTNWIDCRHPKKTPEYLSEEEIIKLYKACKSPKEKYIIAVLFDSGSRAEEFLNIRFEDITYPTANNPSFKIYLKEEYSKTEGRNITMFWKHSTEAIRDYLSEIKVKKADKPVIEDSYDAIRMFLSRLGMKILNRRVHPHLFRHGSATFYASELNRQQLCIRYGWKFSSDMPDVYIKRSGVDEEQLIEKFKGTKIEELNERLEKAERLLQIVLEEGMKSLTKAEKKLKEKK